MRLLFLTRSLMLGGAETQLVSLASGLAGLGHRVAIAVFYRGGPLWDDAVAAGVDCFDLGKHSRWDIPGSIARFGSLVRRWQPDVNYSFMQGANITLGIARPMLRCPVSVWGIRASNMVFDFTGREAAWALRAECMLSRTADAVICNSVSGRDFYARQGVAESRLHVVPNGIDGARFAPDTMAAHRLRREFSVPAGRRVIGVVGRVDPVKGHATVLEVLERVASRVDVEAWFVGDAPTPWAEELRRRGAGLGDRVRWIGPRRDMPGVYPAFDLLLSASLSEGFPNVVLEAAACGVPCVVTDVGDSGLIVEDARFVAPPGDAEALATAVERALAAPQDPLVWRERALGRFERSLCIRRTESLLGQLLDGVRR